MARKTDKGFTTIAMEEFIRDLGATTLFTVMALSKVLIFIKDNGVMGCGMARDT